MTQAKQLDGGQSNTVDMDLLKEQKEWLISVAEVVHEWHGDEPPKWCPEMEGLLSLLDYIQDHLEDEGAVFLFPLHDPG